MDGINNKYNIEIEVLTPLSIGAGAEKDWARGVDFVVDNGNLYKLNLKKMLAFGFSLDELSACFSNKNEKAIISKLSGRLKQVSDFVLPMPAQSDNDVKSFVKNQLTGKPILVGSSLKGAIRSVLFSSFRDNENKTEEVFGKIKDGSDFMRFVRISDADFENTVLINTKIFNLHKVDGVWEGGWKHAFQNGTDSKFQMTGFNTVYECLCVGDKAKTTISLSKTLFDNFNGDQPHKEKKQELFSDEEYDPIENLFYEINNHTYDYIKKELDFFKCYRQADNSEKIIKSLTSLLNQTNDLLEDNQSCILKMSAGAGFHSITGDWQYDDFVNTGVWDSGKNNGKIKYKSRKIAIDNGVYSMMGFVKLTLV
ncbi:MAG: RAMP superfamily CRISPR-associated protein [Paludibacteraceae bacterium]|nr:RAMP superfamily CRISPR-associated protein [Paludibacteraceae bacterium]